MSSTPASACTAPCWPRWPAWPEAGTEVIDLKLADSALAEMAEAFRVFRPFRNQTEGDHLRLGPHAARPPRLPPGPGPGRPMAGAGWMVVTGAGPGIMAAGMEGAGRDKSIGVNIRLPFEQGANPFIAQDPKLVEMRYFFTRKLMLIKESDGYVVLPGGFGTLDEGFELLTLLQTGKAEPAPVVLLDVPGRHLLAGLARVPRRPRWSPAAWSPPTTAPSTWSPTTSTRPPPRSSASTATTTRAGGSATCWSCAYRWRPDPAAAGRAQRPVRRHRGQRRHPHVKAPPTRALRRRPPGPGPAGVPLRQDPLRPAAPAHRRTQPDGVTGSVVPVEGAAVVGVDDGGGRRVTVTGAGSGRARSPLPWSTAR